MTVAQLLSDPAQWTQGAEARNAYGDAVRPDSPDARSWSLLGAIHACYDYDRRRGPYELAKLCAGVVDGSLADFNDRPRMTHAHILDVATRASI